MLMGQLSSQLEACAPGSRYGRLGDQDLEHAGVYLRLCWLWFSHTDGEQWSGLELPFSTLEKTMFFASTFMCVGNSTKSLFCIWSCDQEIQEAEDGGHQERTYVVPPW
jgi:hypothetical protein